MAGIYLHIPFCKQACHYCNFHFSTSLKYKSEMVEAICRELEMQQNFLAGEKVETVYFGGGTPSLLDQKELELIFSTIQKYYPLASEVECTLEANPDDLSREKLQLLRDTPVNRLSIGVQSFSQEDLSYMNRAHNEKEAQQCIQMAQNLGFENLTIDLIYGTPTMSDAQWKKNLETAFSYDVPHLSCYCLTVEPNTALDHFVKKKKSAPVDEEQAARQFEQLIAAAKAKGYIHYEISNFAKEGQYSRHNSAYWRGKTYLGIGPSAHSFDGQDRQWNLAHNAQYIQQINAGKLPAEKEMLTPQQRYNEYLLTTLRTIWGSELAKIRTYGEEVAVFFLQKIQTFLQSSHIEQQGETFRLTETGKLLADYITMELFWEER